MVLKQAFGIGVIGIVLWQILLEPKSLFGQVKYGSLTYNFDSVSYFLESTQRLGVVLTGKSVAQFPLEGCQQSGQSLRQCPVDPGRVKKTDCVQFTDIAQLEIVRRQDTECHTIKWTALSSSFIPQDCVSLIGAHWYGGAELVEQRWPSSKQSVDMKPFLAGDVLQDRASNYYGSVLGRMWISSTGLGIHIAEDVPLHVSFNHNGDQQLCMKADYLEDSGVYPRSSLDPPVLEYNICQSKNAVEAYRNMMDKFFKFPKDIPDVRMFASPIWSTWAQYKMHVNQSMVMEYAKDIMMHNFSNSQLEIDDKWATFYGDLTFDPVKFPQPKQMVSKLKEMGFRVTIWVTPFFNTDSEAFKEGIAKGYFVMDQRGKVPALVKWWQGVGALLDVTNPRASLWYQTNLRTLLRETGIDSFKFDAGEVYSFMPRHFNTHKALRNPGDFTTRYAAIVAALGGMVEMRSAYNSQEHPIFVRMMDKDSVWGYNNGLKTMIPTALVMGILGYPFNLPDMIGGNGYPDDEVGLEQTLLPDRELFVRWVQLSAYLPSMQFSIAPWQYDEEVVDISREMVRTHETVVTPLVLSAAKEAVTSGTPIIRPLWWHDPEDETALTSDSEFLVGDSLLVAPILEKGAQSRDVYLPKGKWKDNLRGQELVGPTLLKDYKTKLSEVATFTLWKEKVRSGHVLL